MRTPRFSLPWTAAACAAVAAFGIAACGSDNKDKGGGAKATPLAVSVAESGKTATYDVPATVKGGLVKISFQNNGKASHSAQLVRIEGNHTAAQAVKATSGESDKTPNWIRGEGGLGTVAPGSRVTATVNLSPGKYIVGDLAGQTQGPPAYKEFTVNKGAKGSLPSAPVTITAANPSKDKYKWEIQGKLKPGANTVTFDSKGDEAIHFIGAFRVTGNPSLAEIQKGLASQGAPPKFIDQSSFYNTAVLDGGKSQTTPLQLGKPGEYVLFCPLSDREGGKGHDREGLLTTVEVG
jgi:hypothetical protein